MPKRPNPKSFRPDEDDDALVGELMAFYREFYGIKSEQQLQRMAYRALKREMLRLQDLYLHPAREREAADAAAGDDSTGTT